MEGAQGTWGMNGVSRDLMEPNHFPNENERREAEEGEEVELSLGLSMNGRFGVDPSSKRLRRSSSVSNMVIGVGAVDSGSSHQARGAVFEGYAPLVRTCSLPAGTEEWRRQKELQSVRSMEARRKRMEKLKNVRVVNSEDVHNGNGLHEGVNGNVQGLDNGNLNGYGKWNFLQSSEGSIGSSSGSSGIAEYQSQLMMGANPNPVMMRSSSRLQFRQEHGVERPAATANNNNNNNNNRDGELLKDALLDMPCVSTRGYGPNCDKIEGFLYRYRKGEEVKIVCVCHGLFLTPAEFVKHAGGGDVAQPLKHIVVNPFPLF